MKKPLSIEISFGELFDRFSILEIKFSRIKDPFKKDMVHRSLARLRPLVSRSFLTGPPTGEWTTKKAMTLEARYKDLKETNEQLWLIEENLRALEKEKDFGEKFILLARSVYKQNDKRARIKATIDELMSYEIREVKSYE